MTILAKILGVTLVATAVAVPTVAQEGLRTLTAEQMEEDFFLLAETLEREHGGLTRYATRDEIDEAFEEVLYAVSEERTAVEFFRIVSELLAKVRCGHTRARIRGTDQREVLGLRGLLPFEVALRGERAWITRRLVDSGPLEPGNEITSIDGLTTAEIRRRAFSRLSGDGAIETGKERQLEREFATRYVLLVADPAAGIESYRVGIAGSDTEVEVEGITQAAFAGARVYPPARPLIDLEVRDDEDVGILHVRQFADPGGDKSFPELLADSFLTLEEKGVGHLVLDLRGNGGGSDTYGALLVSYMTDEPFGYFDRIEVTEGYEGPGGVVSEDGRRLVTDHPGLQIQSPAEHTFPGDVYLLVDGWTFSTAADVATVAHYKELAVLIGEETGGGYDGNTSGASERIVLPSSGITVNVPCWMYTTANVGHSHPGRGAIPHRPKRPSIEDVLAGRDVELELALELVRGD